jgi:hypothetical protein
MALSKFSYFHRPLSSFFRLYVVGISSERTPQLNLPFIVFSTPFPLTTQIQETSFENEENEEGKPLNTQSFCSINKKNK